MLLFCIGATIWTGGTRHDNNLFSWTWSNSEDIHLIEYDLWCPYQPDSYDAQLCLELSSCGYGDLDCSEMRGFKCEYPLLTGKCYTIMLFLCLIRLYILSAMAANR